MPQLLFQRVTLIKILGPWLEHMTLETMMPNL